MTFRLAPVANAKATSLGTKTHFIVHAAADSVGVVVIEDVKAGSILIGWEMERDRTIRLMAIDPVPLGHKIALTDIKKGETITKYGHDIGQATLAIAKGAHAHVHNLRTKRW